MDPIIAVLGVAVPALVAGAVLLILKKPWAGALALGLAVFAAAPIVVGVKVPPKEPTHWFGLLALAAAATGVEKPAARFALVAVLALLGPLATLGYVPAERLTKGELVGWTLASALTTLAVAFALDRLAAKRDGLLLPLALWVAAAVGAAAVALAGFIGAGQVAGTLAAGLGALAFFAWWRPLEGRARAAVPVVAVFLPAIWLDAHWMSELGRPALALLMLAPLGAWAAALPPLATKPRAAVAAGMAGVLIPTAIAAIIGWSERASSAY